MCDAIFWPSASTDAADSAKANHIWVGASDAHNLTPEEEGRFKRLIAKHDKAMIVGKDWSETRIMAARLLLSEVFEACMGVVIVVHFIFAVMETDAAAKKDNEGNYMAWMPWVMASFTLIYMVEFGLRVYVQRWDVWNSAADRCDLAIIILDIVGQVCQAMVGSIPSISALRVFRLARLVRLLRVLTSFRELYVMMHSFVGAMKAMIWASVLMGMILAIWGIIFVELVYPLQLEILQSGDYGDCDRCEVAYSSVYQCMLTFFQQIIAGDSWGMYTLVMIDHHPWTLVLYIPAYIMIGMGMVNLALAAIVDKATDARKSNEDERLKLKLQVIRVLFSQMDEDDSGCVGIEEFMNGLKKSPDFEHALEVMGIRVEDIRTVFQMMDLDNSGSVSYDEFVANLSKMKNEESFMILLYIKHFMLTMETRIEEMMNKFVGPATGHQQSDPGESAHIGESETVGKSKWSASTDLRKELEEWRAKVNEDAMFHVSDMTQRLGSRLAAQQEQLDQLTEDTGIACRYTLAQQQACCDHTPSSPQAPPMAGCCTNPTPPVRIPINSCHGNSQSSASQLSPDAMQWERSQLAGLSVVPGSHNRTPAAGSSKHAVMSNLVS